MPSIYLGCTIDDEIAVGLSEFRKSLAEVQKEISDELATLQPLLDALEGPEKKASRTIGESSKDNEITWEAVESGPDGDQIGIYYEYLGPDYSGGPPAARPPSSYVDDTGIIHCVLPITSGAEIDPAYPVNTVLAIWLTPPEVAALVTGAIPGTGSGLPEPTGVLFLGGGQGKPLTTSESEANSIARVFGEKNYEDLLTSFSVPVLKDSATAQAIINSIDGDFIVVAEKIFVVDGTNLQGINELYEVVGDDLSKLKELLEKIAVSPNMPYLIITENMSTVAYELICGVMQPFTTITETFRSIDENIKAVTNRYSGGKYSVFNNYVFWSESIDPSMASANKLQYLAMPTSYFDEIFSGEDAEEVDGLSVTPPKVYTIEDPELLDKLGLTDAELEELLSKKVDGIKAPNTVAPAEISSILNNQINKVDRELRPNGLSSKVKGAAATSQAVDLVKAMNDENLSKELAERGKACARQSKNFPSLPSLSIPTPDYPNVPSANLPDVAKKVESTYAAISSAMNTGMKVFNDSFNAIKKVINPVLNKLQNLNSAAKNLQDNKLLECALGSSELVSGFVDTSAIGPGTGIGSGGLGDGFTPSIGGIPVPMDLFQKAMTALSTQLNETINSSFEKLMKLVRKPICMLQQLLVNPLGTDLAGEVNPCKDAKDPEENCPAVETQEVANENPDISNVLKTLPQTKDLPTEEVSKEVIEIVEKFSGVTKKFQLNVEKDVSRGIKQVMEDLNASLEGKLSFLDKFDKALRDITGDTQDVKLNGDTNYSSKQNCTPPSVGALTDAILDYL